MSITRNTKDFEMRFSFQFVFLIVCVLSSLIGCHKDCVNDHSKIGDPVIVPGDSIVFVAIGDYGDDGDPEMKVVKMVKSWNPDFIITLGDNNYPKGARKTLDDNIGKYYGDFIYNYDAPEDLKCNGKAAQESQNRFFPSLGNHDYNGRREHCPYLDYFTLPGTEEYYEFIWGPVHFFSISSEDDNGPSFDEQREWLQNRLSQSAAAWKIVYFHHPPYSPGNHGNQDFMQWPFEAWGASAVLTGHDHIYSRILKNEPGAIPYFVNGLGGRKGRYKCDDNPLDAALFDVFCFDDWYGAMKITATSEQITFQFFATISDSPLDTYTLVL
jgi:hypothetical protein